MGKLLSYLKNWGIGINHYWNYTSSKLVLHLIEYCLDQRNNKHMKTVVNSTTQYFESRSQNKMSAKNLKIFGPPTTNWRLCNVFAKLNGNHLLMANIFKPGTGPLTILAIKRGLFCNFAKTFRCCHFMGHSDTDLKVSITIDL